MALSVTSSLQFPPNHHTYDNDHRPILDISMVMASNAFCKFLKVRIMSAAFRFCLLEAAMGL